MQCFYGIQIMQFTTHLSFMKILCMLKKNRPSILVKNEAVITKKQQPPLLYLTEKVTP